MRRLLSTTSLVGMLALLLGGIPALAAPVGNDAFQRTWATTDQPVAALQVHRTWMWGPEANTGLLQEPYAEAPGGQRVVQYFDKSRMEITDPGVDPASLWYVTNGLLATELLTGRMQLGDDSFHDVGPAQVNVAGDPDDPSGPTYATFTSLMGYAPIPTGWAITQTVDRAGQVGDDPSAASYGAHAAYLVTDTNHVVADVFWDFMNSSGLIERGGQGVPGRLFDNPFYATGFPLTEAYWTTVRVGGVSKRVLVQAFQRRVLTYTPDNPDGWKVEAGNVGQHYYQWRHGQSSTAPAPAPPPASPTPPAPPSPSNPLPPAPSSPPPPAAPPSGSATSFGEGTFRVGVDIAPGTYRTSSEVDYCYWERLSGFSGEFDDIITNGFARARQIVTIAPSDAGFKSERCGTWVPDDGPTTASPTTGFSDGTYRVGRDVAPGLWQNSDSSNQCYWARLSGFGGSLDEIVAYEFSDAPQTVRITPTDAGFVSDECGVWTRVSD